METCPCLQAVFKVYDTDQSGTISYGEFESISSNFPFIECFSVLDQDKYVMVHSGGSDMCFPPSVTEQSATMKCCSTSSLPTHCLKNASLIDLKSTLS